VPTFFTKWIVLGGSIIAAPLLLDGNCVAPTIDRFAGDLTIAKGLFDHFPNPAVGDFTHSSYAFHWCLLLMIIAGCLPL